MFKQLVLENPTAQQVFDTTAEYLYNQKKACMINRYCLYRSLDGENACAVGAYLPADHPAVTNPLKFKTDSLSQLMALDSPCPEWFGRHEQLLNSLQCVHDRMDPNVYGMNRDKYLFRLLDRVAHGLGLQIWRPKEK